MPKKTNSLPKADKSSASGFEDQLTSVTLSGRDCDGSVTGYRLVSLPTNGVLYLDADQTIAASINVTYLTSTFYFLPNTDFNGSVSFSYTVVDDHGGISKADTATIRVAAVNDAPVVDLNGSATGSSTTLSYSLGNSATKIAANAIVTDVDNTTFAGGALNVAVTANGSSTDQLSIVTDSVVKVINASVFVNNAKVGSIVAGHNGANGTDLSIALANAATPAALTTLIEHLGYSSSLLNAPPSSRVVTFTVTDGQGTASGGSDTGLATATINLIGTGATGPIVNDAPTGTVTISGSATEDQTLTASNTLADLDGLGAISYHWQRDTGSGFSNISGASASTYQLGDADVGATIRVVASYTDGHGTAESVASGATGPIANVNDAPTGTVAISGSATEDQTLTASNTLADLDGLGAISYHWQRDTFPATSAEPRHRPISWAMPMSARRSVWSQATRMGTARRRVWPAGRPPR